MNNKILAFEQQDVFIYVSSVKLAKLQAILEENITSYVSEHIYQKKSQVVMFNE